ncbi:MAG TPA: pilus assembly protein PilN [Gammaproteobacteria bacterium]|nr:pilus assembly protein PilN [Acidiferrobacteraceae bacterium]MDP6080050.1 PilN domain-containing protein [Arenicellales bacterium]HIG13364.1 pilus assembly protein PilN [Gammaproteobacteria bacterium]
MRGLNLLPWRQERRRKQQQVRLSMVGFIAGCAVFLVAMGWWWMDGQIDHQQARNDFLETEIEYANQKIGKIRSIKESKKEVLARMGIITQLKHERVTIVKALDALARRRPEGMYFTEMRKNEGLIALNGVAESNKRVSDLMDNLKGSSSFDAADIKAVKSGSGDASSLMDFELLVTETLIIPESG